MSSEEGTSALFLASFADGMVKLFDRRLEEDDAIVRTYASHTSWVQNTKWHPTSNGQFFTAWYDFLNLFSSSHLTPLLV